MDAVYCTNSICGPSRASILTGKFSHVNGFYKNVDGGDFNGEQLTFPKVFQKNGYQTAVIGKWHLGTTPTGFDYSKVLINWGGQGTYYNPQFCINGKDTVVETKLHVTKAIENDCLDWLSKRDTTNLLCYYINSRHHIEIGDLTLCIMSYLVILIFLFQRPLMMTMKDDLQQVKI